MRLGVLLRTKTHNTTRSNLILIPNKMGIFWKLLGQFGGFKGSSAAQIDRILGGTEPAIRVLRAIR